MLVAAFCGVISRNGQHGRRGVDDRDGLGGTAGIATIIRGCERPYDGV